MKADQSRILLRRLNELLEDERDALLCGDIAAVSNLLEQKEDLLLALNDAGCRDERELESVKAKSLRNQALMEGALEGVRNVLQRLSDLRRVRERLDTYNAEGRRQTIEGVAERKMEKRA